MKLENSEMSNANELPGRKGGLGLMAGTCMSHSWSRRPFQAGLISSAEQYKCTDGAIGI